ncbi:MAG: M23 family metallopeptidase [Firmicutes bacterium]|nr:M23 family metallopeptidase [Bacillota bacterium]MBR6824093.1 M23 family metallopeptidase [Bacillota bacterium]
MRRRKFDADKDRFAPELQQATYVHLEQKKKEDQHQVKRVQRVVATAVVLLVMLCVGILGVRWVYANTSAYVLNVAGEDIAILASREEAQDALDKYWDKKEAELGFSLVYTEKVTIDSISAAGVVYNSVEETMDMLEGRFTVLAYVNALCVDGEQKMYVANEAVAREAVDIVKNYYSSRTNGEVRSAAVVQEISVVPVFVPLSDVLSAEEAANMLLYGVKDLSYHFVEDAAEKVLAIAESSNLTADQLIANNPGLTLESSLEPGQALLLTIPSPMVQVLVAADTSEIISVPHDRESIYNTQLMRGIENVVTEGVNGAAEVFNRIVYNNGKVIYSSEVDRVVISEPIDEVVEHGTKIELASMDYYGSGLLGWPISGTITSRYGVRSRGWHTGLDVATKYGTDILACESGTVTFSGNTRGGYGYMVKIDHGDGLETYYAHMTSKLEVEEGDYVERGQVIGHEGSTGNSTGPHLHLEVRIDGVAVDPLLYLD